MSIPDVLILGAGPAGLSCARRLAQCGVSFRILEPSDAVGGVIGTDIIDGFRIDRSSGFLFPETPECRRVLDEPVLDLRSLVPAALIRERGRFHRLVDPTREPLRFLASLSLDQIRLLRFRLFSMSEWGTTSECGEFSSEFVERFFRPFLTALALNPDSLRDRRFALRSLLSRKITLPARGMVAIAEEIVKSLPPGSIRFNCEVERIDRGEVQLKTGERVECRAVIIAEKNAARLVGVQPLEREGFTTIHYDSPNAPIREPVLVLDSDDGPVRHLVVLSQLSSQYAPSGRSLVRVMAEASSDEAAVRERMVEWFGKEADSWRMLANMRERRVDGELYTRIRPDLLVVTDTSGVFLGEAFAVGFTAAQDVMCDLDEKRI